ncbi:hypothetical protein Nepgr_024181 [Nepenthes gracilis]|uniref:Uncharacterized protein n=1 Tax=Nepenthes gracilis TaxID=150966 RepID=A0AAD3T2A1_NEPGR|nr:hypothetical protein Nepgr_024181 [Nepenthes gracilis]
MPSSQSDPEIEMKHRAQLLPFSTPSTASFSILPKSQELPQLKPSSLALSLSPIVKRGSGGLEAHQVFL